MDPPSFWNIWDFLLMNTLTQQEQSILFISVLLIIAIVLEVVILPPETELKLFFIGVSTLTFSLLLFYFFIIHPMNLQSKSTTMYNRSYSGSFRPNVIPASKSVKKTIMRGSCHFCGKPAMMGFTCRYCQEYFCSEHRLPEKHHCFMLRNR